MNIQAPPWFVTLGAALYRDKCGFPENEKMISTAKDSGDLFQGKIVKTLDGAIWCCSLGFSAGISSKVGMPNTIVLACVPKDK